jgi:hypothetical protein
VANLTPRCTGQNKTFEEKLLKKFPPLHSDMKFTVDPSTVMDEHHNFLVWYAPGAITDKRAVSLFPPLYGLPPAEILFSKPYNDTGSRGYPFHFSCGSIHIFVYGTPR